MADRWPSGGMRDPFKCVSDGCMNLCYRPSIYCGDCGGYSHELDAEDRKRLLGHNSKRKARKAKKTEAVTS